MRRHFWRDFILLMVAISVIFGCCLLRMMERVERHAAKWHDTVNR